MVAGMDAECVVRRSSRFESIPHDLEDVASDVLDAAFRVHTNLGPGLLESVYQEAPLHELGKADIPAGSEVEIPIEYDGNRLGVGLRADILVDNRLILELKAAEELTDQHTAQLLTYLEAADLRLGFLLNFGARHLRDGIRRVIR